MGGMDLILPPALVRHFVGPLGLCGPMTSTSWTHSYSKQSYGRYSPPPGCPALIHAIRDITVFMKKVAQNPAMLASYLHSYS